MENPIKIGDLGVPLFLETPMFCIFLYPKLFQFGGCSGCSTLRPLRSAMQFDSPEVLIAKAGHMSFVTFQTLGMLKRMKQISC